MEINEFDETLKTYYKHQLTQLKVTPTYNPSRVNYPFTLWFESTDTYENWQNTLKGKVSESTLEVWKSRDYDLKMKLDKLIEFYSKNKITYKLNSNRFRYREFSDFTGDVNLALGCSFTFGTGLLNEHTWPYILEKQLEQPVFNLGLPGLGIMSQVRIFLHFLQKHKIKKVFLYSPSEQVRYEWQDYDDYHDTEMYAVWYPGSLDEKDERLNYVLSNEANSSFIRLMCLSTLDKVCKVNNIELYVISNYHPFSFKPIEVSSSNLHRALARDLKHLGVDFQNNIVGKFTQLMNQKII